MVEALTHLTIKILNRNRTLSAILRVIDDPRFIEAFDRASKEEQEKVLSYIKNKDKIEIRNWFRKQNGEVNLTELRNLGKKYGIKNYARVSKKVLLNELNKFQVF